MLLGATHRAVCALIQTHAGAHKVEKICADISVLMERRIESSQNLLLGTFALNCVSCDVLSLKLLRR